MTIKLEVYAIDAAPVPLNYSRDYAWIHYVRESHTLRG